MSFSNFKTTTVRSILLGSIFTLLTFSFSYAAEGDKLAEKEETCCDVSDNVMKVKVMNEYGSVVFEKEVCNNELVGENFDISSLPESSTFLMVYEDTAYYYQTAE